MIRLGALLLLACTLPASAQAPATSDLLPFTERFAAHATATPRTPALKPAVTIVGEIVRIGDLIEHAGASAHVPIFRAPDLGETGRVAVERVIEAVLPHDLAGVDTRGLTEVTVTRASITITPQDLELRIAQALAGRQRNAEAGNLTLTFDSEPRPIQLEPGTDLRLMRLAFDPRNGRFDVVFERPGVRNLLRFTGTYAESFAAIVLARPLAAGEVVRAGDVTVVRRTKAEFNANVITVAEQAVGLAARRAMRPGDLLRQTDLAKPEVIARNDNVTITYQAPGITLTLRGKALDSGSHGDTINVLNVQSKRSVQATVAGPGHVIVAAVPMATVAPSASRLAAHAGQPMPTSPSNQPRASAE